jgi:hypothetical protein
MIICKVSEQSNRSLHFQSALTQFCWQVLSLVNIICKNISYEITRHLFDGLEMNIFMLAICDNSEMMGHQH